MPSAIQRIVLRHFSGVNIHCPFCGSKVLLGDEEGGAAGSMVGTPCAHTLFVGHDVDLEYRSEEFNRHLGLDTNEDIHGEQIDNLTDEVTLPDAIKIVIEPRPNAGANSYIGFAITTA
jgi:hypothetical protein